MRGPLFTIFWMSRAVRLSNGTLKSRASAWRIRKIGAMRCWIRIARAKESSCSASALSGSATATTSCTPTLSGAKPCCDATSAATTCPVPSGARGSSPTGASGNPYDSATIGMSADSSMRLTSRRFVTRSPP